MARRVVESAEEGQEIAEKAALVEPELTRSATGQQRRSMGSGGAAVRTVDHAVAPVKAPPGVYSALAEPEAALV